jgi:hypothetical protein
LAARYGVGATVLPYLRGPTGKNAGCITEHGRLLVRNSAELR